MALGWLWWRAWFPVDAVDAAGVCVAGVVLGDTCVHSAWQVRHLVAWTSTLRGRRGWLWWRAWFPVDAVDAAAVCVAGVALGDIDFHFACQARRLMTSTFVSRGRRRTWRHLPSFCVAGVALGDIHLLSRTIFHTPLCHPPSLTHHLSHTTLSHTIFDTPLCHTPSFTHHL